MKRVFWMIAILFLANLGAKAQWSLNPEAGLSLNVADVSGIPCLPSWKVGVAVDYDFTPRWGVSSGIYFTERRKNEMYAGYGYGYGEEGYGMTFSGFRTVVGSGLSFYFPLMGKVSKDLSEDVRLSFAAGPWDRGETMDDGAQLRSGFGEKEKRVGNTFQGGRPDPFPVPDSRL